jgi:hypothetical protein
MTKTQAKRKLMDIIDLEGVNTVEHLQQAETPMTAALTFNVVADAWERKRLPQLKASTQYAAPILNEKYLRPFFGKMSPASIKTGVRHQRLDCRHSEQAPQDGS